MEALGRLFNVVLTAKGVAVNLKDYSAVTFVCSTADTFTLTCGATSASADAIGSIIDHYYQNTSVDGTAAWTKVTQVAANNVVQAGANVTLITVHNAALPDTKKFVKCSSTGAGPVVAILHDLDVQRGPANLALPSAA